MTNLKFLWLGFARGVKFPDKKKKKNFDFQFIKFLKFPFECFLWEISNKSSCCHFPFSAILILVHGVFQKRVKFLTIVFFFLFISYQFLFLLFILIWNIFVLPVRRPLKCNSGGFFFCSFLKVQGENTWTDATHLKLFERLLKAAYRPALFIYPKH